MNIEKLSAVIGETLAKHQDEKRINPSWIATEAMRVLEADGVRASHPLIYLGCHLYLRQLARSRCRQQFEGATESDAQHELFPGLQRRYPAVREGHESGEEAEYVLLEEMRQQDFDYNITRLRKEGLTKLQHADALTAYRDERKATTEAVPAPQPTVLVRLAG